MKRLLSIAAIALITTSINSAPALAQVRNSNINQTQAQMQYRIKRGIQSGRLSGSEARRLQHRMNEIARLENQFRRSGRGMSHLERTKLQNRLATLNNQINRDLNDLERRGLASNINQTQMQLQARINRGILTGRLTGSEARGLQHKMNELAQLENRFRSTGRGMSFSERAKLQNRLAILNNQINRDLNDFERRGLAGRNNRWR